MNLNGVSLALLLLSLGSGGCAKVSFEFEDLFIAKGWKVHETSETRLRLGDRSYVSSVLTSVFGPSAEDPAQDLIDPNIAAFGGPCDPYASGCNGSSSQASVIGVATSSREALRTRACERIVANDTAVNFAVSQAGAMAANRPADGEIRRAYDLFYPGKNPTHEGFLALENVVASAESQGLAPLESWRFLFLSLCLAPDWQVP